MVCDKPDDYMLVRIGLFELIDFWFDEVMGGDCAAGLTDANADAAIRQVFQGRLDGCGGRFDE